MYRSAALYGYTFLFIPLCSGKHAFEGSKQGTAVADASEGASSDLTALVLHNHEFK
jgi:hypothetical protein